MKIGSENQNLKLIVVFLIGVFVGGFSFWIWDATQDALYNKESDKEFKNELITDESVAENDLDSVQDFNTTEVQLHNDLIIVRNQPSGLLVSVEKVSFEEDGWIVIHEGTTSHIGNALGAARFDSGEYNNVEVNLLRTTELGVIYRAVLYRDNGDKEFNLDSDFPFLQNGNQPVLTTFNVE